MSSSPFSLSSSSSALSRVSAKQSTAGARPGAVSRSLKPAGITARASRAPESKNSGRQLAPGIFTRPAPAPAAAGILDETDVSTQDSAHHYSPSLTSPQCPHTNPETEGWTCPTLPLFDPVAEPNFRWGALSGQEFTHVIHCAYLEIAHWKRNVFLVPSGKHGKAFVRELTSLFTAFAQASALELVALEAVMVGCALLLQKPHPQSKSRDHVVALERRLRAWQNGDIDGLMREGRTLQKQLEHRSTNRRARDDDSALRSFTKLMLEGNVRAALRFLSDNHSGRVLSLDECVDESGQRTAREVLGDKHPAARELQAAALLTTSDDPPSVHPVYFERITGSSIRAAAMRIQGAAGPSGVDATGWRRICTAFHRESADLCASVAALTRRLCTEFVDPKSLRAFVACRLIPLDKSPGVRPIGVCEVIRRIVGKAIMSVVKDDVLVASGPLQLCGGHQAGSEAAVHAMRAVFEDPDCDAVILVDAVNAFNNLNRQVALRNIQYLCPAIAPVLINCYRDESSLFVGGEVLFSREGTTQGDPLSMTMFALAVVPLIEKISTESTTQAWFADDSACGGKLRWLRKWWDRLRMFGPAFGYFPNAVKTILVVKSEKVEEANEEFKGTGIEITTAGRRYLGGCLGSQEFANEDFAVRVADWTAEVIVLAEFAKSQPHAAYAALTHGLIGKWTYQLRLVKQSIQSELQPLEDALSNILVPALTGQPSPNASIRNLLALPTRQGGLGIANPFGLVLRLQEASRAICKPLTQLILDQGGDIRMAQQQQHLIIRQVAEQRRIGLKAEAESCISALPDEIRRAALAAQEPGASSWLSTVPVARHGFALHKRAFSDALCLRYGWRPPLLPQTCKCGEAFDIGHALICRYGGFQTLRHNQLRDLTAELLTEVCHNVCTEPVLQRLNGEQLPPSANKEDHARLDVRARGFWDNSHHDAFFDVRVFYPLASSYSQKPLATVYREHERKKKLEYGRRVREIEHGSFTPLVFTVNGGMAPEATVMFKRLANLLAEKQQDSYGAIMGWLRCRISFNLLRSSLLCLRGTRAKPSERIESTMTEAIIDGRVPRH